MNRLNCCKIEKVHWKIDLKRWSRETRRWEVWRGQTQKQDQRAWHMLPWEPRGGAEWSENRECLQTPRTDEKYECKDRESNPPRESKGENPQPDTLQENASDQAEKSGHSQRHGSEDSSLSAGSRSQNTGKTPSGCGDRATGTQHCIPGKTSFQGRGKKWSQFTGKQNLSLLLQTHSKGT